MMASSREDYENALLEEERRSVEDRGKFIYFSFYTKFL